jgi:L-threonylcarbamoyladenylate synthase
MTAPLRQAARALRAGGVIAYATEHCFGLGCDPLNPRAVARLLRLKRRAPRKGLILIAADIEQLAAFVTDIPSHVRATWPGPHTWLLGPRAAVPRWITGAHTRVAVRVTAHSQAAALCRVFGKPIVSTSANRAGIKPARTYREVCRRFGTCLSYVLPGRVGKLAAPTPIRDAASGVWVRPG